MSQIYVARLGGEGLWAGGRQGRGGDRLQEGRPQRHQARQGRLRRGGREAGGGGAALRRRGVGE